MIKGIILLLTLEVSVFMDELEVPTKNIIMMIIMN